MDMTSGYRRIDLETWPRREHYSYYTNILKVEYSLTARVEVGPFLDFCHRQGLRFYPALICAVTRVVNRLENFRMFRDQEGALCVWDWVVPNYTIFHDDDKTFSDCWTQWEEDFGSFYRAVTADMDRCRDRKGIKAKGPQPGNFFCVSCAPWVDFTGFSSRATNGDPQLFPVITMGKYTKEDRGTTMPVCLLIAHAVCDGYHAGLFFSELQKELDDLAAGK